MMLRDAVKQTPGCDGVVLGGHGLFTWGNTQRECYVNTLTIIDQLGQFVTDHVERKGSAIFGGAKHKILDNHREAALKIFAFIRGRASAKQRWIGHFNDLPEILTFVNSKDAAALAHLGTSCPDHFIRTKIRPLYVEWEPQQDLSGFREAVRESLDPLS